MPSVPLPQPPQGATQLPPAPHDPPSDTDIVNALAYRRNVQFSYDQGVCTDGDLARAVIYEAKIIAERAAQAVPGNIAAAVGQAIAPLVASMAEVLYSSYAAYNRHCASGDGREQPFKILPFANGDIPTDPPHNLPGLRNEADITALTRAQAAAYLIGYQLNVPHHVDARKKKIRAHIGAPRA